MALGADLARPRLTGFRPVIETYSHVADLALKKGRRLKRFLGLKREAVLEHRGGIEHLLPGRISGWVVVSGVSLQEVRLLLGTHLIAKAEIDQPRPDVCDVLGCTGQPGFTLLLPHELPLLDSQPAPRVLALSADGSVVVNLDLIRNPEQTTELLQSLLQSELLGLDGHLDGLQQGNIQGWAGRRGEHESAQIWLQADGQEPWSVLCNKLRDGMQVLGLPVMSGFSIDPKSLPSGWSGQEVWCSFDKLGQFRLPQTEPVFMPSPSTIASRDFPLAVLPITTVAKEGYRGQLVSAPEELRNHWQMLESFRIYLDRLEEQLDQIEQRPLARPRWWSRLLPFRR